MILYSTLAFSTYSMCLRKFWFELVPIQMHNTDNKKMQIVYSTLGIFQEGCPWSVASWLGTPHHRTLTTFSHFKVPLPRILKKKCSIQSNLKLRNLDLDILLLFCVWNQKRKNAYYRPRSISQQKNPPTVPDKNLLTVSFIYFNLDKKVSLSLLKQNNNLHIFHI